jgi:lantibiotic modifying enzyme
MLLNGPSRRRAQEALREISRCFLVTPTARGTGLSLARGRAGLALVHHGLEQALPRKGHLPAAQAELAAAVDQLSRVVTIPSLFHGFVGVAWVAQVLGQSTSFDGDDACGPIDQALEAYVSQSPWKHSYDLYEGLVGVGTYALQRMPRASAQRILRDVVSRLGEIARPRPVGIAWWSDPRLTDPSARPSPPAPWNLGLAHGVPGVIAFLSRVVVSACAEATREQARRLLPPAVEWLLAQELPESFAGCFPDLIGPSRARRAARLSWCYGDLGIASSLLEAGRAMRRPAWESAGLRIALRAANRPEIDAGVIDMGLCHGSAGVAYIFHRLHVATREPKLASAASYWFERTLALRGSDGFAGVRSCTGRADGRLRWRADRTFLGGAGGVALALATAVTDSEPRWGAALLVS